MEHRRQVDTFAKVFLAAVLALVGLFWVTTFVAIFVLLAILWRVTL